MKATRGPWLGLFARQLIKTVCTHVGLSVLASLLLYVAIDTVETGNMAKNTDDAWQVLKLELVTLPVVFQQFAGMAILIGTATTLASLIRRGEVVAMFAAGGPPSLLLKPVFLAGLFWALGYGAITEWVAPGAHAEIASLRRALGMGRKHSAGLRGSRNWFTGQHRIFRVGDLMDTEGRALAEVLILKVRDGRLVQRWDVQRLTWDAGTWTAHDVVQRTWATTDTQETEHLKQMQLDLPETPEDFVRSVGAPERLSFGALSQAVAARRRLGQPVQLHEVELFRRIARPFTLLFAMLAAAALILRIGRHPTVAAGLGAGTVAGFSLWLVEELALALAATSALSAGVAVAVPAVGAALAAIALWGLAYRRGITD